MVNNDQRYFSCTACGKCCDRSPEVELSESLRLSDVFIFSLMFRSYELARSPGEYGQSFHGAQSSRINRRILSEQRNFLEKSASIKYRSTSHSSEKTRKVDKYIYISALTFDLGKGHCSAIRGNRCGIYERRPFSCRTVPFHYSMVDSVLQDNFDTFVARPGYECDTAGAESKVLQNGKLVDKEFGASREAARAAMVRDAHWRMEIARRINAWSMSETAFPSRDQINQNARFGVTTISILHAWKIGVEIGVIDEPDFRRMIEAQIRLISKTISNCLGETSPGVGAASLKTLMEMAAEYRAALVV